MSKIKKGDYLYHKREGIMLVEDITSETFGDEVKKFLVLRLPYSFESITMMVPLDQQDLFREPRTPKEMDKVIPSFKSYENLWIIDNKTRKESFNTIIDSDDTYKIHCIAKTIQEKRNELSLLKKPLPLQDVKILDLCLKLIKEEIAFAYKLDINSVEDFINTKLGF